jgi:hypothetical protein
VARGIAQDRNSAALATFGLATSSFRATWLVKRERIDDAARALHATFIERKTP